MLTQTCWEHLPGQKHVEMTDLFCDNVSMFICELLLAYLLPRNIFNLIALWTEKHLYLNPDDAWDINANTLFLQKKNNQELHKGLDAVWRTDLPSHKIFKYNQDSGNTISSWEIIDLENVKMSVLLFARHSNKIKHTHEWQMGEGLGGCLWQHVNPALWH